MALRVLTNDERIILNNSSSFKEKVKQALRDSGDFWANNDGSSMMNSLTDRLTWARNRYTGVSIVLRDAYVQDIDLSARASLHNTLTC